MSVSRSWALAKCVQIKYVELPSFHIINGTHNFFETIVSQ